MRRLLFAGRMIGRLGSCVSRLGTMWLRTGYVGAFARPSFSSRSCVCFHPRLRLRRFMPHSIGTFCGVRFRLCGFWPRGLWRNLMSRAVSFRVRGNMRAGFGFVRSRCGFGRRGGSRFGRMLEVCRMRGCGAQGRKRMPSRRWRFIWPERGGARPMVGGVCRWPCDFAWPLGRCIGPRHLAGME